jgi:hypothetical protein
MSTSDGIYATGGDHSLAYSRPQATTAASFAYFSPAATAQQGCLSQPDSKHGMTQFVPLAERSRLHYYWNKSSIDKRRFFLALGPCCSNHCVKDINANWRPARLVRSDQPLVILAVDVFLVGPPPRVLTLHGAWGDVLDTAAGGAPLIWL